MERRDFFNSFGTAALVAGISGVAASCSKSSGTPSGGTTGGNALITADLSSELASIGSAKQGGGAILIRTGAGNTVSDFSALSLTCTHQGCTVAYDQSSSQFACPCHGSEFTSTGAVLQGPAATALAKFKITINGNTITVG
ncbi:QcrA and Rieske domain-containing protein [Limnovirga soli]|jgi:cytochrome b6-f complex iron-sulfur subunit|uniref:Rieske 2Fe-2S domain-containing protein n=1 Tax=Limnovirga soli TaxID=2656915 RepID=A0A8J8JYP3_9BACT|nr:Rieske (2Fe-2S) protein [Limnovirga soli]NNV57501.1 Rieske 2Fe-2S domain-containing protein [Limnovirga soli]